MTDEDLLRALSRERYEQNQWWTRKPPKPVDDELTCRRRLAECVREAERVEVRKVASA